MNAPARIEVRSSPIHGSGVFAVEAIAAGTRVAEYRGELIDAETLERRAEARSREAGAGAPVYFFEIGDGRFIDATDVVADNPARFINHSCDENCEAVWDARERRMEIVATRAIAAGEELSFDYGFGLAGFFEHPCRCGAKNCCGFIVAKPLRAALMRRLARHARAKENLKPATREESPS